MKNQTACFTGHREINMPAGEVKRRLNEVIDYLISKGVYYFGNGGALGFDTISCMAVIEAKQKNPKVKLILVLPCKVRTPLRNDSQTVQVRHLDRRKQTLLPVVRQLKNWRGDQHTVSLHAVRVTP